MAIVATYPGVYVQELPSGVRTIVGVSTSTAVFIGRTKSGPMFAPTLVLNYGEFEKTFSSDASVGDLARQVKQFFTNGGTRAWIVRIAKGATQASVVLKSEGNAATSREVLILTAKSHGLSGEDIRAVVSYGGPQPEASFTIELFRWVVEAPGRRVKKDVETWRNLSMDPASPLYAPTFLTQNSKLVDATPGADIAAMPIGNGYSQSGRPVPYDSTTPASFQTAWAALLGDAPTAAGNQFQISVGGSRFVNVDLSAINVGTTAAALATAIKGAIDGQFAAEGMPGVTVTVSFEAGPAPTGLAAPIDATLLLRITAAGKDVFVRPAGTKDLAAPLMLGTAQGGIEVGSFRAHRPAPSGLTFDPVSGTSWNTFAEAAQNRIHTLDLQSVRADGTVTNVAVPLPLVTTVTTDGNWRDANGGADGVREKLRRIADAINAQAASTSAFAWTAELWGHRLAIVPTRGADSFVPATFSSSTAPPDLADFFTTNTRCYSVGIGGAGNYQIPAAALASDGDPPLLPDYESAFRDIDRNVDLFNLMVLPPDDPGAIPQVDFKDVWGVASVFCQKRRAFLLMDAPSTWTNVQTAASQIGSLRVGLVKDHAAIFFPRLIVNDAGKKVPIGPSGTIAGLMARIDATRGVWKAPAGTEADLRGVVGIERAFSDDENGVLNPRAINTIRVFPNGIVCWGARTMDGDDDFGSEYKYTPIRRLALYIEESLYRGLKWVTFEPNDEPLWQQIRLNAGAFMNNLFRQGAFQGAKPRDAYFVKCDEETTTQNDRNLGIVNIVVGFAPLKPAEFVFLYLQQMAGQIQA